MSTTSSRQFLKTALGGAALVLCQAVLAQQSVPEAALGNARVARVEAVSGRIIHAFDGAGPLTLSAGDRTRVWKGKMHSDLSPLQPGDIIGVRLQKDRSGNLFFDDIWANIASFSGIVMRVAGSRVELAVSLQATKPETRTVVWTRRDTAFEDSLPEDIRPGRFVQVVGLELGSGVVQASRIIVWDGDRPVRMPNTLAQRRTDLPK